jgi:flagellar biosynthesis protein FlhB
MNFILRLLLLIAGLVFALSLLVAMAVLMALWGMRALWGKLTGKPVQPFIMRMNPRSGFDQVFKRAQRSDTQAGKSKRELHDVTDVEPKS